VPALLPSFGHLSLEQQKEAKKQTIPALLALFDKAEKQKIINLDCVFHRFEWCIRVTLMCRFAAVQAITGNSRNSDPNWINRFGISV